MSNENNQIPNSAQSAEVQNAVASALQAEKKKKKKKKWIILGVVAVVIILIAALSSGGKDDGGKKVESLDSGNAVTDSAKAEDTTAAAPSKVEAGNVVTTDKLKISYISCNADYKKYNEYSAPEKGNKVVRAEFKFENISDSDISLSGFECYADDKKCEAFYGADDNASSTLESVSPGRTLTAVEYFEVPEGAKNIELEYEDDLWGNEKTIFVIK